MNIEYITTIVEIIKTGHWFTDQVTRILKPFDISEPQYNVLRILRGRKGVPITVQDIQADMIQKSSNVTRIIDKLLKRDLVDRKECPSNRRKMDITITNKGLDFLNEMDKTLETFHEPMGKNLTIEELQSLRELIIKLKK